MRQATALPTTTLLVAQDPHRKSGWSQIGLQARLLPSATQIDPVSAHRYPLCYQERSLSPALREAAVGADDAMPWEVVVDGREDKPHEARRVRIDVAIGTDEPGGDGPHFADDALGATAPRHFYIVIQLGSYVPGRQPSGPRSALTIAQQAKREMQVKPARDRRPLLIAAVFTLLFVSGLGAWPGVRAQLCPSILVASSNEKSDLMASLAKKYSATHPGPWSGCGPAVNVERVASGDAERQLAEGWTGGGQPDVWAPAASTWVDLLRYHLVARGRQDVVPPGQPIARSPLVIAMPEPMAQAMSWPSVQPGWKELLQLADDPRGWGRFGHAEWGAFRLGKTDPNKSTSGLHSLIAAYYAATGKSPNLTDEDLTAPATQQFVAGVESSVSHYAPTVGSFLDNLAAADKLSNVAALSYISALAVEEQEVYHYNEGGHSDSTPQLPPRVLLDAIYPNGETLEADHPYVLLRMSDAKVRIATGFLQWLLEDPRQARFQEAGFRNHEGVAGDRLARNRGIVSGQPTRLLQRPAPRLIAAIQRSWQTIRKSARILILLALADQSQRADVRTGVEELSDRDDVAIWTLEPGRDSPTLDMTSLRVGRSAVVNAIDSAPIASGRVPLYLNIQDAYRFLKANSDPKKIDAIVVIAANLDDDSGPTLTDLEHEVRSESAGTPIRIYTVALAGSDQTKLTGIEKASGGVSSSGDPAAAIRSSLANF